MSLLTSGNGQSVNAIDHIELNTYPSEAEIKKRILHSKMQFEVELALLRTPPPLIGGRAKRLFVRHLFSYLRLRMVYCIAPKTHYTLTQTLMIWFKQLRNYARPV